MTPARVHRHAYERLILGPGAYDLPLALPGWILPGVIPVGAALSLLKRQGALPGKRIVWRARLSGHKVVDHAATGTASRTGRPGPWAGLRKPFFSTSQCWL